MKTRKQTIDDEVNAHRCMLDGYGDRTRFGATYELLLQRYVDGVDFVQQWRDCYYRVIAHEEYEQRRRREICRGL